MRGYAREIALFRYALIREAADPSLANSERGRLVRELAAQDHAGPAGERVRVSRESIDRWIRAWRKGGFDALVPVPRRRDPRTPIELLALAERLKREAPRRTAAQVAEIIRATGAGVVSERTLQRLFARLGLHVYQPGARQVFGRFEAEHPNDLWTGDVLHGAVIGARKTYLFAFLDDHSRLLTGYRWGLAEDTLRLEAALRRGLSARGIPKALYVDNGSPFVSHQLLRACAVLGIRLVHSTPHRPQGRGKIERVFRTVTDQFLVELDMRGARHLPELNELFAAWVETIYHRRPHSETGQSPLERFGAADDIVVPSPDQLTEAFLWRELRRVTKTATVSLYNNLYEVDAALVGATVELLFDPFTLDHLEVRYQGRVMGVAVPQRIGRHVHPHARTEQSTEPVPATGIDYLGMIRDHHLEQTRRRIAYSNLPEPTDDSQETR
jgi:putative transposase